MKVLVIGGGGREHALVWKIAQSKKVKRIYCAPGNAGIARLATLVPIGAENIDELVAFVKEKDIDLTVVGPEGPLSRGIVDRLEAEGKRVFGASQKAAELESSKRFAKDLMRKYGIPTAEGETFTHYEDALAYLKAKGAPIVVKADGLAAGKGVLICNTLAEAENALKQIMEEKVFGDAGNQVVIEECLKGEEVSFLAITDGETVLPFPTSQDHKRIFDNDEGPNTGGMGAYSPAPLVNDFMHKRIMDEVMLPTVKGMKAEGRPYKGILYAGLMIDQGRINVLEFNARFGDPEAQPLLMRLKSDIVPLMEATIDGTLGDHELKIEDEASVCVVMASGGYPGPYEKGFPISGLEKAESEKACYVFHAGTDLDGNRIVAVGGRVLGITALGDSIAEAIEQAYACAAHISWEQAFYRKDIGQKALDRMQRAPEVGIVMGSDSDYKVMKETVAVLKKFDIPYEITVASAHRTPQKAAEFASTARARGLKLIIAGAGHAAHLAGAMAAHTTLPVIGVPIDSSALDGMDALLTTVQMPPGVPVATVAIGKPGATNAGVLAAQIIGVANPLIEAYLDAYKKEMAAKVEEKSRKLLRA